MARWRFRQVGGMARKRAVKGVCNHQASVPLPFSILRAQPPHIQTLEKSRAELGFQL